MYSPLEQFKIEWLLRIYNNYIDLTISNITLYLIYSIIIIYGLNIILTSKIILNNYGLSILYFYDFIEKQLIDIFNKKGIKYIPFCISIFIYILINNFIWINTI